MEEDIKAQALLWKYIYGFADSFVLKCAIQLGIADILHEHGQPMTLSELATSLPHPSINEDRLYRFMRYLVHMKLLGKVELDGLIKYSLTPESKLVIKNQEKSLASFALLLSYEMDAWHHLSASVEGGDVTPFERCKGMGYREYFAKNSAANQLLSDAMTSHTSMVTDAVVKGFEKAHVLDGMTSLIDVGGSTGVAARAIAKAFPEVKCAVFDLPHVIATAPECPEVTRIEGDVFVSVPKTDLVFMKSVLHDWGDEDCVKILNKCKEAIADSKQGKIVLVEIVMDAVSTDDEFKSAKLGMEMDMLVTVAGKERSEQEWQSLFKAVLVTADTTSHPSWPLNLSSKFSLNFFSLPFQVGECIVLMVKCKFPLILQ